MNGLVNEAVKSLSVLLPKRLNLRRVSVSYSRGVVAIKAPSASTVLFEVKKVLGETSFYVLSIQCSWRGN